MHLLIGDVGMNKRCLVTEGLCVRNFNFNWGWWWWNVSVGAKVGCDPLHVFLPALNEMASW